MRGTPCHQQLTLAQGHNHYILDSHRKNKNQHPRKLHNQSLLDTVGKMLHHQIFKEYRPTSRHPGLWYRLGTPGIYQQGTSGLQLQLNHDDATIRSVLQKKPFQTYYHFPQWSTSSVSQLIQT